MPYRLWDTLLETWKARRNRRYNFLSYRQRSLRGRGRRMNSLKNWWFTLTREEYELTIYYPGPAVTDAEGITTQSKAPITYRCKAVKKLTQTHIVFIDMNGHRHEIKLLEPVGYEIKKIY